MALTLQVKQVLYAGEYELMIKDANNCIGLKTFVIEQAGPPLEILYSITDDSTINLAIVGGDTSSFAYIWEPFGQGNSVTGSLGETFMVTVTDAQGCSDTASITIPDSTFNTIPTLSQWSKFILLLLLCQLAVRRLTGNPLQIRNVLVYFFWPAFIKVSLLMIISILLIFQEFTMLDLLGVLFSTYLIVDIWAIYSRYKIRHHDKV